MFFVLSGNQFYFSNAEPLVGQNVRRVRGNEFPFVVTIGDNFFQDLQDHTCTGSLISRNHVLTAAHCLKHVALNKLRVKIGSSDILSANDFEVSWWLTYDEWALLNTIPPNDAENDIAVIKVKRNGLVF